MSRQSRIVRAIAGAVALAEMLDCIGREGADDHTVAKILTDNELELRVMREMFLEILLMERDRNA